MAETKKAADGVASASQNAGLKHSQGGVTTRDDATDSGVPMLPGKSNEPVGPEDALGVGPKRGDYSERLGGSAYNPHESLPADDPKPGEPTVKVEPQRPRAEDRGDAPGKGGVNPQ